MLLKMKENFKNHKIDVKFFDSDQELKDYLQSVIANEQSVSVMTTDLLDGLELFRNHEHINYVNKEGNVAWGQDHFITEINAISLDGSIINLDCSGEKIKALTFGPSKVHVIIDRKNIFATEREAVRYILREMPPKEIIEEGMVPPCLMTGVCHNCSPLTSPCNYVPICRGQFIEDRLEILCI